jgi:hypothetical protein
MIVIGVATLFLFVAAVLCSTRGWIPQRTITLQTILLLVAVLAFAARVVFGPPVKWAELLAPANLHPVTSTVAGFLLAGALSAAGAFDAAAKLLDRLTGTTLGLPFAIVLLVNLPSIFAMPCGRILASPLMPIALALGWSVARLRNDPVMVPMVVFGMLVNAGASCTPSLIGGIGTLAEGMGHYPQGSFANAAQFGIVAITIATMALIRFQYRASLSMKATPPEAREVQVPAQGYTALALFVALLLFIVLVHPKIPLQMLLVGATLAVMALAGVGFSDLLAGVVLHPLSAMLAGYLLAAALTLSGGFDALLVILVWLATHSPLGWLGVAVLLVNVPLMLAMPCGRIISVSLIPGVLMFGEQLSLVTGFQAATPVLLCSFVLCGASSCGPSPIGGVGNIGEGRLRIRDSWSSRPQALGIFLGVPVTALLLAHLPLSGVSFDVRYLPVGLGIGILAGAATNLLFGYRFHHLGGLLGGVATGALMVIL